MEDRLRQRSRSKEAANGLGVRLPRGDTWKGLKAGILAGIIAAWAMGQAHALLTNLQGMQAPKSNEEEDSTVKTASMISEGVFHHVLTTEEKKMAGPIVHYAFGASVGGTYGAVAETMPMVTRGAGVPLGVVVWLGAHVIIVPSLGLSKPVTRSSLPDEVVELGAHVVYGAVTELVRRMIRKWVIKG